MFFSGCFQAFAFGVNHLAVDPDFPYLNCCGVVMSSSSIVYKESSGVSTSSPFVPAFLNLQRLSSPSSGLCPRALAHFPPSLHFPFLVTITPLDLPPGKLTLSLTLSVSRWPSFEGFFIFSVMPLKKSDVSALLLVSGSVSTEVSSSLPMTD